MEMHESGDGGQVAMERKDRHPHTDHRWRTRAYVFGAASVLLLAALATSLGIFLSEKECGAPPAHALAAGTYTGKAAVGAQVSYVCPAPLVFPSANSTFIITCGSDGQWDTTDVPSCGTKGHRQCSFTDSSSSSEVVLSSTSYPDALEVELIFRGPPPASLLLDIPAMDQTHCYYSDNLTSTSTSPSPSSGPLASFWSVYNSKYLEADEEDEVYKLVIMDTEMDPRQMFDVRLRGVGARVAVSLLQGEYVRVETFSLINTTTALPITLSTQPTDSSLSSTDSFFTIDTETSTIPSSDPSFSSTGPSSTD